MPEIRAGLPALYHELLPALFRREIPVEEKATCDACAMCAGSCGEATEPVDGISRLFRADTKCCTFHPRLPNYLVGALLADARPELAEGRRRMEAKIAARIGVTPHGIKPPAKHTLLYANVRHAFGRAASLRCPFYEEQAGSCTIWAHREAVCSTWYCRYVAGADGQRFWEGVKRYLSLVETQLERFALFELAPELVVGVEPATDGGPLSPEELEDRPPTAKAYEALWRGWAGRERELYLACHDRVRALSAAELERIVGFDGVLSLADLERRHDTAVAPRLPATLRFNPATTVKWLPDGSVALAAYSELEALALPAAAYPLLLAFTGQEPVDAVRARLRAERRADLDEEVLLALHRHRVLVTP